MKNLSLILRIVAIIAAVAALSVFFMSKGKLAEKEGQLTQAQQRIVNTQADLDAANETLKKTESQLKRESASLADTQATLTGVRSELSAAQKEANTNKELLSEARSQIGSLETRISQVQSDLVATQEELAAASREAELSQLNAQLAELQKRNEELAIELAAKTAIADAVTAKTGPSATAPKLGGNLSGGVLTSSEPLRRNRLETTIDSVSPKDGLIVLKSSPELGLTAGQVLSLVQDMKSVGKVQIQSITDTYAIGNILPNSGGAVNLVSGSKVEILTL